jgi:nucleotide-binding universal stress UspA family protein
MRRFKKILYVHEENSEIAEETLRLALELANRNDGQVDLIAVLEPPPAVFASNVSIMLRSSWLKESEQALNELAKSASPDRKLKTKLIEGRPHIQTIREVLRNDYDLVIKPIGPSGVLDRFLGRFDMQLLRHCPCPVWLSKGEAYKEFDQVLAAVGAEFEAFGGGKADTEEVEDALNRQILEMAFSLCADSKAWLHIGHAWYPPFLSKNSRARANIPKNEIDAYVHTVEREHTNWLKRLMNRGIRWVGKDVTAKVKLSTHLRQGDAGTEIPKLISEFKIELLIMGTVARTGISGLIIGNTAESILDQVTCSVLVVKPSGFVSSVTLND